MFEKFFDKHFIAKAIYGSISILAVLLIMEEHPPNGWTAAITLFGTVLAIAIAEVYSESIAEIIGGQRRISSHELGVIWEHTRPILIAANVPTLILIFSALGLFSLETAFTLAEISLYFLLFLYGARIGQILHESTLRILLSGFGTVGIGLLVSLIKLIFH